MQHAPSSLLALTLDTGGARRLAGRFSWVPLALGDVARREGDVFDFCKPRDRAMYRDEGDSCRTKVDGEAVEFVLVDV